MGDNNSHSQWVEKGLAYKKDTLRDRDYGRTITDWLESTTP